jgi:amino acid adenylation domain-containing protein
MGFATFTLLHDILDWQAQHAPDSQAVRSRAFRWTYGELRAHSLAYAQWLRASGVRPGDRVLVIAPHAPQTVAAIYAASRVGALYVVVSDRLPERRLREVVANCEPRVMLAARSAPAVTGGPPLSYLDELPAVPLDQPPAVPLDQPPAGPCLSIDPVSLIYTSGSTAAPKAVVSTHRQVLFAAQAIQARLGYRADDAVFCCLPLSFDYGLYQVFLSCLAGAELVLAEPDDAGPALLARLHAEQASVFPLMPSLAAALVALLRRSPRPPARLRLVTSSGAVLPSAVAGQLRAGVPGLAVVQMFGLTECKRVTIMEPNGDIDRPGALGQPLPDTELFIVGPDGARVPPGKVGELVVRGGHVMSGYWRAPELTGRKFRRDEFGQPLLFTGDQCRVDGDGYLYFVGRQDDIYKQRGFRISTVEVESAALDIPGVLQAAVIRRGDDRPALLLVSGAATVAEVLAGLADRLEDFKLPGECRVMDALPLGPSGKVDKRALAARLLPAGRAP